MLTLTQEEKDYLNAGKELLQRNDVRGYFRSLTDQEVPFESVKKILLFMYEGCGVNIFEYFKPEELKRFLSFETRMIYEAIKEGNTR